MIGQGTKGKVESRTAVRQAHQLPQPSEKQGSVFIKYRYKISLRDFAVYLDNKLIRVELFFLEIPGLFHHGQMRCPLWKSELLLDPLFVLIKIFRESHDNLVEP